MREKDFEFICTLAFEQTGISLSEHKKEIVYSRIVRRIRTLKFLNFSQYCEFLKANFDSEVGNFISAITTNLTFFFREPHQFDYFSEKVIPEIKKNHLLDKKVRIWSAGCSTGEEPYSIAIALLDAFWPPGWDVKILASDLDLDAIGQAKAGIYKKERIEELDVQLQKKWFLSERDFDYSNIVSGVVKVKPALQEIISFKQINLLKPWPMHEKFDVIFCRNVVIYFNKDIQRILFDRFADLLCPNGYLFIGHSESLYGSSDRFDSLGGTMYKKIK